MTPKRKSQVVFMYLRNGKPHSIGENRYGQYWNLPWSVGGYDMYVFSSLGPKRVVKKISWRKVKARITVSWPVKP